MESKEPILGPHRFSQKHCRAVVRTQKNGSRWEIYSHPGGALSGPRGAEHLGAVWFNKGEYGWWCSGEASEYRGRGCKTFLAALQKLVHGCIQGGAPLT